MKKILSALVVLSVLVLVGLLYVVNNLESKRDTQTDIKEVSKTANTKSITITSDIPEIQAEISNMNYIRKILDDLNFWEGKKIIFETKSASYSDLASLDIILTREPQEYTKIISKSNGQDQLNYSVGLNLDKTNNKLKMYIHINKDLQIDNNALSKAVSSLILMRTYSIKKPISNGEDAVFVEGTNNFISIVDNR